MRNEPVWSEWFYYPPCQSGWAWALNNANWTIDHVVSLARLLDVYWAAAYTYRPEAFDAILKAGSIVATGIVKRNPLYRYDWARDQMAAAAKVHTDLYRWYEDLMSLARELKQAESVRKHTYGYDGIEFMQYPSGMEYYEGGTYFDFDTGSMTRNGYDSLVAINEDCITYIAGSGPDAVAGTVHILEKEIAEYAGVFWDVTDDPHLSKLIHAWRDDSGDPAVGARRVGEYLEDVARPQIRAALQRIENVMVQLYYVYSNYARGQ